MLVQEGIHPHPGPRRSKSNWPITALLSVLYYLTAATVGAQAIDPHSAYCIVSCDFTGKDRKGHETNDARAFERAARPREDANGPQVLRRICGSRSAL